MISDTTARVTGGLCVKCKKGNAKIPYASCGAMILQSTAKATGGLCKPCEGGYRKDIGSLQAEKEPRSSELAAIGIPQPVAWLIINGYSARVPLPKPTEHRGAVLIYALPDPIEPAQFKQFLNGCRQLRITSHPAVFDLGGFVGTARITACESDESAGAVAVLESPEELGFVRSHGRLGIFNVFKDPFPRAHLVRTAHTFHNPTKSAPSTPSVSPLAVDEEPNEPSFFEEWADAQRTAKRILKATNDPIEITLRVFKEIFGPEKNKR